MTSGFRVWAEPRTPRNEYYTRSRLMRARSTYTFNICLRLRPRFPNRIVIPTGALRRDPLFIICSIESGWKHRSPLCHPERSRGICGSSSVASNLNGSANLPFCHPDRSEAERRDLQFYGPVLEMFFESA
jgi:hypothetical protein